MCARDPLLSAPLADHRPFRWPTALAAPLLLALASGASAADEARVRLDATADVIAVIDATCAECDWGVAGREAVMLRVTVDGTYSQHVPLVRTGRAEYRVFLGALNAGSHVVRVEVDHETSATGLRGASAAAVRIAALQPVAPDDPSAVAMRHAPFIYERPGTVAAFSDLPVFMWYEVEPTGRGTRYRYSVVFTHEDGGTPADRLMATWGRTTDIEYVYSVELSRTGEIVAEDYQGVDHETLPYRGTRAGGHPHLWVTTLNNMLSDRGATTIRFAPAPAAYTLDRVSREVVMDDAPWLYSVMAKELRRERRVVADAPPEQGVIPDPRRFVYLEACGELNNAALAFAVRVLREGGTTPPLLRSDRGVREYRIVRDGCFRAAIPLPPSIDATDIQGLVVQAYTRPPSKDGPARPAGPARLSRVNRMFTLDERDHPRSSFFAWAGAVTLDADGAPVELKVR